jgi:hypothetical protein
VADGTTLNYTPSALSGAPPAPTPSISTPYAPSALPGAQPNAYAPSFSVKDALVKAGATPQEATTLTAISGAESGFGKHPVSPPNKNGSRDYGYFQINDAAHPQMGGAAVASMPLQDQAALALQIARSHEGFGAWTTYKNGAYKAHLGQDGSNPAAPVAGGGAAQPAAQPANVGSALAALTAPGQGGMKSTMDSLQQVAGGGGGGQQAPPPLDLQPQQAAAAYGNARQAQIAAMAPQLMLAARQMGGLHGIQSPAQTQAFMGGQVIPMPGQTATPGTTLNSTGGLYG